jgi:hypothetical protein
VAGSFSVSSSNSSTQTIDSSGDPYSQANPFPVVVVGGGSATTGSAIIDSSGVQYSGSNPLPVVVTSGGTATSASNIVDSSGVAYSGSNPVPVTGTVAVSGVTGSIGATILNGEGVARDTWGSAQVGTWNIATLTGITNTVGVSMLNGDGITLDPRNRNWTITETVPVSAGNTLDVKQVSGASWSVDVLTLPSVTVTSITNTVASSLVDSTGIQYSGSNPLPITGTVTATPTGTQAVSGTVAVSGITNSIGATILNGEGIARDSWGASQVGTWNITTLTGITNSLAASIVDSTGVQYSGSNPVPTKEIRSATGTNTSVADNAASVTILASNTARLGATVYNDSSATLYLLLGATAASTTNYTCRVVSSGYYEVPFGYTGQLTGIWASDPGDGAARVTELT